MIAKILLASALVAVSLAQHYGLPQHASAPVAEEKYPPQPYEFGYETNDDYGTTTFRKEQSDGKGKVQGSYGYKDLHGIERIVEYVADEHGYRAQIKTNEPGTESQNPADVILDAKPIIVEEPPKYSAPAPRYSAPQPQYLAPEPQHIPHYPRY